MGNGVRQSYAEPRCVSRRSLAVNKMICDWLRSWWHGKKAGPRRVVMYTRRGCHLCDDAHGLLKQARARHGFTLEIIDVDLDPALVAQYGAAVPVVAIDGRVRFRGRINLVLLRRVFK
jgi:glutaredoxin